MCVVVHVVVRSVCSGACGGGSVCSGAFGGSVCSGAF